MSAVASRTEVVVLDASTVVAFLVDSGANGRWAEDQIEGRHLCGPHLLSYEVANVLRRLVLAGEVEQGVASLAFADLERLDVELYPFGPFAERVWELRGSLTGYDASYVALAELLDAPLATLDRRIGAAHGPRCEFRSPAD